MYPVYKLENAYIFKIKLPRPHVAFFKSFSPVNTYQSKFEDAHGKQFEHVFQS